MMLIPVLNFRKFTAFADIVDKILKIMINIDMLTVNIYDDMRQLYVGHRVKFGS